jgi:hypothetical protein
LGGQNYKKLLKNKYPKRNIIFNARSHENFPVISRIKDISPKNAITLRSQSLINHTNLTNLTNLTNPTTHMAFTDIPTEQTTAVTDIILALLALIVSMIVCYTGHRRDPKKARIWTWAFGLLAIASAFGAVAHGIKMTEHMNFFLWQPINFALGLTIALFAAGVVYDLKGTSIPRFLIPVFLAAGMIFYFITIFIPGTFIVFILYEALAMMFALISYVVISIRKKRTGYWLMAVGIMISIIAAGFQATTSMRFTFIWEFDHNGIFHIIQIAGLFFLLLGLRSDFLSRPFSQNPSE